MVQAKKAGFVNADPDTDGYLRRLSPIIEYNGKYYGQLVLVPMLHHFGNPKIVVSKRFITLKNCRFSSMEIKDIKIPRGEDGNVIIKYPKKDFIDYNAVSLWNIYRLSLMDSDLESQLSYLNDEGYFDYLDDTSPWEHFSNAKYVQGALEEGDTDVTFEMYKDYRTAFINTYDYFLNGGVEEIILADFEDDPDFAEEIKGNFAICRELFNDFKESREKVGKIVRNSMCIVGTNATSTTDYGLNQYEEHYPNPGVHYAFANMINSQDFVDDAPFWVSILIAVIICLGYSILTHQIKSTGKQIITGIISLFIRYHFYIYLFYYFLFFILFY